MFFKTHEDWEITKTFPPNLYNTPGERIYPVVEIEYNYYIFHVDILPAKSKEDDMQFWLRFLACDILQAINLIHDKVGIEKSHISIQTRRCDNKDREYKIFTIKEAFIAEGQHNQRVYLYKGKNKKTIIDSDLNDTESDLSNLKLIYSSGE